VTSEHRTFRFTWTYNGVSLKLKGFGMIAKPEERHERPIPGTIPQGFSFMAILELSAGASLAPRLWWAERALGLALIGVGLASARPLMPIRRCWWPTMAPSTARPRPRI
jgi:hypothetical protein